MRPDKPTFFKNILTLNGFINLKLINTIITYKFNGILKILIKAALCSSINILDLIMEFKGFMNPLMPLIPASKIILIRKFSM